MQSIYREKEKSNLDVYDRFINNEIISLIDYLRKLECKFI